MKVNFTKKNLVKAVNKIGKIAFFYKTNELYNNLKISLDDCAVFQINNDIAFLKTKIQGDVIGQGEICVNPCDFVNIINSLNSETIQIESTESRLYIRGNKGVEIYIPLLSNKSFIEGPRLVDFIKKQELLLNSDILKDAFANCLPFENPKSLIQGINFKLNKEGQLRLCCCSELSACLYYIENINKSEDLDFTLDTRFLRDFKDIFDKEKLNISIYERFLEINTENTSLIIRFLNKKFPSIEKVLENPFKKELPIVKSAFEQAFDLIDVVTKNIDSTIIYKDKKCTIRHEEGVNVVTDIDTGIEEEIHIEREQLRKVFRLINKKEFIALFDKNPKPIVIKEDNKTFLISVLAK